MESNDIYEALSRSTAKVALALEGLESYDLFKIINIILNVAKPKNKLEFTKKYYKLEESMFIYKTKDYNLYTIQQVFNCLLNIGVFTALPVYNLMDLDAIYELYINTPMLYKEILDEYSVIPNETKEGILFEACAVTQISILLQDLTETTYYSIRTPDGSIEYDWC